jgi:predicted RNA-binding protein YlqC (UPF0109 family)
MVDLSLVLTDIAKAIVDNPDAVAVDERTGDDGETVVLTLSVAEEDMGMIIGKHGKIAKAIRTVMKAASKADNRKVVVDIKE